MSLFQRPVLSQRFHQPPVAGDLFLDMSERQRAPGRLSLPVLFRPAKYLAYCLSLVQAPRDSYVISGFAMKPLGQTPLHLLVRQRLAFLEFAKATVHSITCSAWSLSISQSARR